MLHLKRCRKDVNKSLSLIKKKKKKKKLPHNLLTNGPSAPRSEPTDITMEGERSLFTYFSFKVHTLLSKHLWSHRRHFSKS